ncbi:MAG: GspE/PulE family protein [Candidatus Omnitrophota bacterium]
MSRKIKKSLGEMLLEHNIITDDQWMKVQSAVKSGESVRKSLIKTGFVSEEDMVNFLAEQMSIPRIDLNSHLIDPKLIELVPEDLARKHQIIPVLKIGSTLTCVMADVFNLLALDEVMLRTGLTVEQAIATEKEIQKAIDEHYTVKGTMQEVIRSLEEQKPLFREDDLEADQLKNIGEEPPVIKLVNMTIMQAVSEGVSDIHIEPDEDALKVRYRVDGVLSEQSDFPRHLQSAIISRIKILSNMNIAERRKPQDGRFQLQIGRRQIDIRVSCMPTIYGENIVMRLLDQGSMLLHLKETGFQKEVLEKYIKLLYQPNGIILVTGPTGSGKTTTLYASLNEINTPEKNIVTIEDPVEYRLKGIRQIQINPSVDLTFATGLRSILRQDPDIIMVGEIRDLETAEIAVQAALTGHLVLATLHTNNAAGAVARLIDMGIEPFLISSSLTGVLAQRLVRRICQDCSGKGCPKCHQSGYKTRTGIYELMRVTDPLRQLIIKKASSEDINQEAVNSGMITLREDGMKKVDQGITTREEILRVTQEEA